MKLFTQVEGVNFVKYKMKNEQPEICAKLQQCPKVASWWKSDIDIHVQQDETQNLWDRWIMSNQDGEW